MACAKIKKIFAIFFKSTLGMFTFGALIGFIFFVLFCGLAIVNPTYTDWIFYSVTHDTAQHFIGWQFFRADSTGGIINGLAYPVGLPITFMDSIPLLAFPFKIISGFLPGDFQYFGIWAIACYMMMGGLAAVLMKKIWQKIFGNSGMLLWQILFVAAGALIFVLSPVLLARTLYHSALAAQWLILLGFILIWDANHFSKKWKFIIAWSLTLAVTVLIHPYFLPMIGSMMLIAAARNINRLSLRSVLDLIIKILIPILTAIILFWAIGGFSLGSGAEVHDLDEKGFNLLSFTNANGYSSLVPGYSNASSSPETMMWLGLGVWLMITLIVIGNITKFNRIIENYLQRFKEHFGRNSLITFAFVGLLIFSIGVRVDFGSVTLFQYSVPDKVYEIWSAFRAAAREAWPFYYLTILVAIYGLARLVNNAKLSVKKRVMIASTGLLVIGLIQFTDLWFSQKAMSKRESFSQIQNVSTRQFQAIDISDLVTTQKNLVMLDTDFRGDMTGTYKIGQTALRKGLTLNIGFFARIPNEIWTIQDQWRDKVRSGQLHQDDLASNILATNDKGLAMTAASYYTVELRDGFYFILK